MNLLQILMWVCINKNVEQSTKYTFNTINIRKIRWT